MNNKLNNYEQRVKEKRKGLFVIASLTAIIFFIFGVIASSYFDLFDYSPLNEDDKNLAKLKEIYEIMKDDWYFGDEIEEDISPYTLEDYFIDKAIWGLTTNEIDPHTGYSPVSESSSGPTCGLGILMERLYGYPLVSVVYPNSRADIGGIKESDLIVSINGENVRGVPNSTIQELVRVGCGSKLTVTVNRDNQNIDLEIELADFIRKSAFLKENNANYILIKLIDFSKDADEDFIDILESEDLPNNLILDLRNNGGGDLSTTVNIATSLLGENKKVVSLIDKKGNVDTRYTNKKKHYDFEHIYILINENSASASEVLTLALKEHLSDKVSIIGTTSYGKGTAQHPITLSDGSSFRYTFAKWYSPINEVNIHGVGINPDYYLTSLYTEEYKDLNLDVTKEYELHQIDETIKSIKVILNNQGYDLKTHAYFDEELYQALLEYQEGQLINETGKIDVVTLDYLIGLVRDEKVNEMTYQVNKAIELMGV